MLSLEPPGRRPKGNLKKEINVMKDQVKVVHVRGEDPENGTNWRERESFVL